jgi:hypothetical protein
VRAVISHSDSAHAARNTRLSLVLVLLAFLPYLPAGLRAEHLMVLPLTAAASVSFIWLRWSISWSIVLFALLLSLAIPVTVISTAMSPVAGADAAISASLLRVGMPALLTISFAYVLRNHVARVHAAAAVIASVGSVLGIIAAASTRLNLSPIIAPWVRAGDDGVWAQALSIGRVTGLFNQPLEAGTFFSVALFCCVFLWASRRAPKWLLLPAIVACSVGGAVSLSKNFLVLGILFSTLLAIGCGVLRVRTAVVALAAVVVSTAAILWRVNELYATSLLDLFDTEGLFFALSAGRFGGPDTEVSALFGALWADAHWILGFGLGAHLPLDNGFLEYFYQGGIVAVLGYIGSLVVLATVAIRGRNRHVRALLATVTLFIVAASFGGPVLTANRANVPLLLLVVACVLELAEAPVRMHAARRTNQHPVTAPSP